MSFEFIEKFFTWLKGKIFRKEKPTYGFKTKTNNSNIVININIAELHYYNSSSTLEDIRSKYDKKINKK